MITITDILIKELDDMYDGGHKTLNSIGITNLAISIRNKMFTHYGKLPNVSTIERKWRLLVEKQRHPRLMITQDETKEGYRRWNVSMRS